MSLLRCEMSMSLDGFIAGPNDGVELGMGRAASVFTSGSSDSPPGADLGPRRVERVECVRVIASPHVTHLKFRPRR